MHNGVCTPEQRCAFQDWLARSPAHQQAYQEIEAFWQQLGGLETIAQPQLEAARAYASDTQRSQRCLPRQTLALAASVLLMVLAVPSVQLCLDNGSYRTAKGDQTHIALSDGTQIDLNTDTEVRVSYTLFSRTVKLEHGEALFTVKHDADKPFEVVVADSRIRDIGTQFNVYRQGNRVAVTVLEGEVKVIQNQSKDQQVLTAGMQFTYGQGRQHLLANLGDYKDAVAWREGRIVFKGQRLGVVLEQLARYHAVKLTTGNARLQSLKVSGSFSTSDLNLALNTIAAGLPVKLIYQGADNIVLAATGKSK